jgi:hypothetical protein
LTGASVITSAISKQRRKIFFCDDLEESFLCKRVFTDNTIL